jgi:hypothetical protein
VDGWAAAAQRPSAQRLDRGGAQQPGAQPLDRGGAAARRSAAWPRVVATPGA